MFRNYLKVAWRNLLRQKLYAFINIFGLALGIACCLLMALFVMHEWSYDHFHERKDRIFRLVAREVDPAGRVRLRTLHPLSMVEPLAETFPGIGRASGFMASSARITGGGRTFYQAGWRTFAYRIELGSGIFLVGGLLALGIAWLTVSFQAVKAALANPVEALRYE